MKIGIMLDPNVPRFGRFGDDKFNKMREYGFEAADYTMKDTNGGIYLLGDTELKEFMESEKNAALAAGIEISQVHGPWRWPAQDHSEEIRRERLEHMKRSIFATSLLGCKHWVVHPLMPLGVEDLGTKDSQITFNINFEFMSELAAYGERVGVVVCLENMPMKNFSLATPCQIYDFVKAVDSEYFKACLDTGHANMFCEMSPADAVRKLGPYLKVLHVHDNFKDRDAHAWPTKGDIDWADFMKALKEIDYKGTFSLETAPPGYLKDEEFESECKRLLSTVRSIM